jgi:phosphate transport system permease protein
VIDDMPNEVVSIRWKGLGIRKIKDGTARIVSYLILALMAGVLVSIFAYILGSGATHVTISMFTTFGDTTTGGLLNAIIGTWMLVGMGLLFSIPPGILGAIYIVNSKSNAKISYVAKLFTDVLTSVPSIVIGLFGYLVLVIKFGFGYSLIAGGIALGIMMLPYLLRIIEISFRNIPREQIENAYALGANDIKIASRVYLPQASKGIMSGILLAISIASGETAQLIYTAGFNNALPTGFLKSQVAYLTYVVWTGINQPSQYSHYLAYVSAMILILTVTALIFASKYIVRRK